MEFSRDECLVQIDTDKLGVAVLKINRPDKRNALPQRTIDSLVSTIAMVSNDEKVRVVVLTGSRREGLFSAGTDLSEFLDLSTVDAHKIEYLKDLSDAVTSMGKPIIASVAGYALGAGFELAMMCDIIYASDDALFGLPELTIGTIPGAGGTQRLTKILGKQKAMHMILTSATMTGKELHRYGLVAQCWAQADLYTNTMSAARKIASRSAPVVQLAKQAILNAEQMDLNAGIKLERALYYSSFSLEDRKEGMAAFVQKRDPVFNDKWDGSVGVEAKRGQRRTNSLHTLNWFSLDKEKFVEEHDIFSETIACLQSWE